MVSDDSNNIIMTLYDIASDMCIMHDHLISCTTAPVCQYRSKIFMCTESLEFNHITSPSALPNLKLFPFKVKTSILETVHVLFLSVVLMMQTSLI